jgi:hypothetical protein
VQLAQLEHWYEAMRLMCVSWEEAEDAATTLLRMMRNGMVSIQALDRR